MTDVDREIPALSVSGLLDAVASEEPTPGGGAVAGVVAGLAAALAGMVGRHSARGAVETASFDQLVQLADSLRRRALELADADRAAYQGYVDAAQLPREPDPEPRRSALRAALHEAVEVPYAVSALAAEVASVSEQLAATGNPRLRSDACAAALLGAAAAASAAVLVRENLHYAPGDRRLAEATRNAQAAAKAARSVLTMVALELDDRISA